MFLSIGHITKTKINLSLMDKHFVIASKNLCSHSSPKCRQYAQNWAHTLLIFQSTPQIFFTSWRKSNPTFTVNYMQNQLLTFDTDELFDLINCIYKESTSQCKCVNQLILRSNDGLTAEDPSQQPLID